MPRSIWALGFVSLFMDMSSELIHGLLPVFMVTTLGATALAVGLIEGVAEATAQISKIFSGLISDYLGKRKLLTVIGYSLAAVTKPLFPLADSVTTVLTARFIDRIGKGIRGAPRDALVADLAPVEMRGAAYGLRQSMDTIGAAIGPFLAIALMWVLSDDIRAVFWVAVIPAFAAVFLLVVGVQEPASSQSERDGKQRFQLKDIRSLDRAFWIVVIVGGVMTLARFSEAFLILRAQDVGLAIGFVPFVLVLMSIFYALSSYPAGVLADRMNRKTLMAAGFIALFIADIFLATAGSIWLVMLGVAFWGLHMGLTQGLLATMVADASPAYLRGSAFGIFNLVTGALMLVASGLAGLLWDLWGPSWTFWFGAFFSAAAVLVLVLPRRKSGAAT